MSLVTTSITYYPDTRVGRPVFNGNIFIGEPDTDPEIPINQKDVSLILEDGTTVSVGQPIPTGPGGVVTYQGSYAVLTTDGYYSIKVLDSQGRQVYYIPTNSGIFNASQISITINGIPRESIEKYLNEQIVNTVAEMVALELVAGDQVRTKGYNVPGDGGNALYLVKTIAQATLDGDIIDETGGGFTLANGNIAVNQASVANVLQWGAVGDGVTSDTLASQSALDFAVSNKMELYFPSPNVSYAFDNEVNLNNFLGQQDLNVTIRGDGFSSNYVDGKSDSLITHTGGYTGYLFDLSISVAPSTSWFTLKMEDLNLYGLNLRVGRGLRVIGCHYFLNNVGINELDIGFRPEQCFRGDVRGCSIARNNLAVQFAGYNSATSFTGSTLRGNDKFCEFAQGYPSTYGNDNRLDNVNFLYNNMESNDVIFDCRFGRTSHIVVKYNYMEGPGDILLDASDTAYQHYNWDYQGMSDRLHLKLNKMRDANFRGESLIVDEYSNTNSTNVVIDQIDTVDLTDSGLYRQSTANISLFPSNTTSYTLNDDPDFTLHSTLLTPFILPREWSQSSTTPTYSWEDDTPYGSPKKVLKYDSNSGSMRLDLPIIQPVLDTWVHGLVSLKVESGVGRIGFQIDGGGINYGDDILPDTDYIQHKLRIPIPAGTQTLTIYINLNGVPTVFYVDAVIIGYDLIPKFKQSESFAVNVTIPPGAGLTLNGDTDLYVQASVNGSTNNLGVNANGTTSPTVVHSNVGDRDGTLLITPRIANQRYRISY